MRTRNEHGGNRGRQASASTRLRRHLRSNVVGYLALFVALSLGTAQANHLSVRSSDIVNGQVKTKDLKRKAVKTSKLAPGAVKRGKLAPNTVDADRIVDGSIGTADLGAGSVGASQIANGSVGAPQILNGSIGTLDVADDSLTGDDIDESTLAGGSLEGYERVFSNSSESGSESPKTATADCPFGTELLGGGGNVINGPSSGIAISDSGPGSPANAANGIWSVEAYETVSTGATWTIRAWAFCAEA